MPERIKVGFSTRISGGIGNRMLQPGGIQKISKSSEGKGILLYGWIMILSFFLLAGAAAYMVFDNYKTNNMFQSIPMSECADSKADIAYRMKTRGGSGGSWTKETYRTGRGKFKITGITYDVTLKNRMDAQIEEWFLEYEIKQDMYLNSAWCGTMEVHQHIDGVENVQRLDLRTASMDEITLDYVKGDKDILIPLSAGDTVIYYPSEEVCEYPIKPHNPQTSQYYEVTIGMIFYFEDAIEPTDFVDGTVNYRSHEILMAQPAFRMLLWGVLLWLIAFMFLAGYYVQKKSAIRAQNRDRLLIREVMEVFTNFVDAKDAYTAGHSDRVAQYAALVAEKLNYKEEEILQIYYCGKLHDCGKISIAGSILNKPGKLTDEEFAVIKNHTVRGYEMLKSLSTIPMAATAAKYHHERYDGKGYPEGLEGSEIPMHARIICVADSFDAMNSTRVYRPQRDADYILRELKENSGKQFDPRIVEIFLQLIEEGAIKL